MANERPVSPPAEVVSAAQLNTQVDAKSDPPIVLPIESVHLGATRKVILRGTTKGRRGAQLTEGAILENNYRLKKIERDKLVVSLNGRDRSILLGGN